MNLDQISREFFNTPPPPPPLPPHQNIPCLKIPNHNLYIKVTTNYFIEKKPRKKKERKKERKKEGRKRKNKNGRKEKRRKKRRPRRSAFYAFWTLAPKKKSEKTRKE